MNSASSPMMRSMTTEQHGAGSVGGVPGGVVSLDEVAAGRAGHEGVVERARPVEDESSERAEADPERLQQQVPADAR